jgi:hypothetical protein
MERFVVHAHAADRMRAKKDCYGSQASYQTVLGVFDKLRSK